MKRKTSSLDEEESRLSSLLFNKSKKFAENLPSENNIELDLDLKPAWLDEDDDNVKVNNVIPNIKSDGLYTQKLKQKYETLVGTPNWAKIKKPNEEDIRTEEDKLVKSVGHLIRPTSEGLRKSLLEVRMLPQINAKTHNEGSIIASVEFHPKMSVSLVAGQSGIVSLFSIGGKDNNKLHNFCLKKWRISTAQFTPDGSEAYITSKLRHEYCIYNLVKAEPKLVQLPRVVKKPKTFVMSHDGKFIATSDGFNEVYIICTQSRELIRSLKHNTNVQSLAFSHDSAQLLSYCVEGEITMWDMSTFRAQKKFYDDGCVTASCIATSPCGRLFATGSGEGIVNVYDATNMTAKAPLPHKTISNLKTKVTNLKFNAATEILSIASNLYPEALKLVHIPSYHVFCNFPTQKLYQVETVNFSPNSGYLGIGNNKGSAYLYRLKYYPNY